MTAWKSLSKSRIGVPAARMTAMLFRPSHREWGQIFPDPSIAVSAIAVCRAVLPLESPLIRLTVHHATILEFNTESRRRRAGVVEARGRVAVACSDD